MRKLIVKEIFQATSLRKFIKRFIFRNSFQYPRFSRKMSDRSEDLSVVCQMLNSEQDICFSALKFIYHIEENESFVTSIDILINQFIGCTKNNQIR